MTNEEARQMAQEITDVLMELVRRKKEQHKKRKFKQYDIVRYLGAPSLVVGELENGEVLLASNEYVRKEELTLICPGEVVRKMGPWEGGEND